MIHGPHKQASEGELAEVSVDPHGWAAPVSAERLGGTTADSVVLCICFTSIIGVAGPAIVGHARARRRAAD